MILPLNQVIVGDCAEVMQAWPADSIDLVMTSPPYWGLRDYGSETVRIWGGDPECEHEWGFNQPPIHKGQVTQTKYGDRPSSSEGGVAPTGNFCSKCGAWRGSLGLEPHPQLFIDHLVEICREIRRVLKPSGTFWLNLGDTYCSSGKWVNKKLGDIGKQNRSVEGGSVDAYSMRGKLKPDGGWIQPKQKLMIPSRVAIALQHDGWILRNDIIWHKPNHMPSPVKDRLTNAYEHVFMLAKARRYYFDLDAIRKPHAPSGLERAKYPLSDWRGIEKEEGKPKDGWLQTKENPDKKILKLNPSGKNPGDLWRIPTKPFPGAHFATFPPKLIEPIVKAGSPKWICSKCGKPRIRITEKTGEFQRRWSTKNKEGSPYNKQDSYQNIYETTGWSDCGCGEKWVGGIVLDPFGGSGTAGQVARKLGRRFILIEIKPEYADMARQRVRGRYKPVPEGVTPFTQDMEAESNG